MEKKLPDDNLEEFLRNSFNQYKEKPSDELWDRINNSLATPLIRKPSVFRKIVYPIAATILLISISILIYSNFKLRSKLDAALAGLETESQVDSGVNSKSILANGENNKRLNTTESKTSTDIRNATDKINEISTENANQATISEDTKKAVIGEIAGTVNALPHQNKLEEKAKGKENNSLSHSDKMALDNGLNIKSDRISNTDITNPVSKKNLRNNFKHTAKQEAKRTYEKGNKSKQYFANVDNKVNQGEILIPERSITNNQSDQIEITESISPSARDKFNITSLQVLSYEVTTKINPGLFVNPIPINLPFLPERGIDASEMGVLAGTYHESGKINNERGTPQGAPNIGKRTNEYASHDSWQVGIILNKSISKNLFLTSGIGFKHFNIINDIKQNITFGNRKPKPGGMPFQHDFDFKIKCNAGSSDIVIKSEQLDQRASFTDNQPIEINVQTEVELNYLSVPIGLQYRIVKNNFFAGLGLGLNFDVLTRSTVSDPEVKILNNILKPVERPKVVRLNQTKDVVLNSKLNLVMGYSVNKNFKLLFSPELYMPISNRTQDRDGTIDANAWGIQAGIAYNLN